MKIWEAPKIESWNDCNEQWPYNGYYDNSHDENCKPIDCHIDSFES